MAVMRLPIDLTSAHVTSDVGKTWKGVVNQYEEITKVTIESMASIDNVDEAARYTQLRRKIRALHHDETKIDNFRTLMS